jgi:hypothetical protein
LQQLTTALQAKFGLSFENRTNVENVIDSTYFDIRLFGLKFKYLKQIENSKI